jgi:hypothetical protein
VLGIHCHDAVTKTPDILFLLSGPVILGPHHLCANYEKKLDFLYC